MLNLNEFWPPISTLIHGVSEHEHLAITKFKTSLEHTYKSLNMIKQKSNVLIDKDT
jgi:hypothetical protein